MLFAVPRAHAQENIQAEVGRVWGELGFYTNSFEPSGDQSAVSFGFGARYRPIEQLELDLTLGFAWAQQSLTVPPGITSENTELNLANPTVGVSFVSFRQRMRFRVGGALALPVGNDSDYLAMFFASAMEGFWDLWLWAPERLGLVAPFRIEGDVSLAVTLFFEAALAAMIDVGDGDRDTLFDVQLAGGAEFHLSESFVLGLRLQGVYLVNDGIGTDDSTFQAALEPYLRVEFGGGFVFARVMMNLDRPLGFAFDEGRFWGLFVGGGGRF